MSLFPDHGTNTSNDVPAPEVAVLLRENVRTALRLLGNGFLDQTASGSSRQRLTEVSRQPDRYYAELLRLAYQLLFLLVVESRELLHPQDTPEGRS